MHVYYTYLALDLARERAAEADAARLAALASPRRPRFGLVRRVVARAAIAVARAADGDQLGQVSFSTH